MEVVVNSEELVGMEVMEVEVPAVEMKDGPASSPNQDDFHGTLFRGIKDFYDREVFCDLRLYAMSSNLVMKWGVEEAGKLPYVPCHAIVLSSVIPCLKNLLQICEWDPKEEAYCLFLPDVNYSNLKMFVDQLYCQLVVCDNNLALDIDGNLARVLGLSDGKDYKDCFLAYEKPRLVPADIPRTVTGEIDYDAFNRNAQIAKIAKTQYQAQVADVIRKRDNPFLKQRPPPIMNDLIHVVNGQIHLSQGPGLKHKPLSELTKNRPSIGNIATPHSYLPQAPRQPPTPYEKPPPLVKEQPILPAPELFENEPPTRYNTNYSAHRQNFRRLESALFGFRRNMGCFHAITQPYYATPSVTNDPENLVPGSSPQEKRQFRMKLPNNDLIVLVAVGLRDGQNVATTLAIKTTVDEKNNTIPDDVTMANIIDMAKSVCGTSSGVILRHPRCSMVNQDKISREAIDTFKSKFKDLTKGEKANIATECQIFLKEFDTVSPRAEFHHLPSTPRKLEFVLVDHIPRAEILDYALVYGDAANHFVVRSLFNFNYQNIPDIRRITIILDLISCFVGLDESGTLLTDFQPMREIFNTYAKKTCQNLAVQELGVLSVEREEVSSDVQAVNLFADDSQFAMKTGALGSEDMARKLNIPIARRGDMNSEGKYKCTIGDCKVTCVDKRRLNAHVARMHTGVGAGVEDPKACVLCGRVQRNSMELKMHWYRYHKECKCKDCGEEFKGMSFLQAHRSRLHYVLVKCDQCGEECKGTGRLRLHKINKHLEDHQKPFVCSYCGKGYAEKIKLKAHQMNVHIRSRPYKCRIEGCKADFNCLANRNAHEKSVHKYDFRNVVSDSPRHPPTYVNRKEPTKRSRRAKKRQAEEDEEAAIAISQLM